MKGKKNAFAVTVQMLLILTVCLLCGCGTKEYGTVQEEEPEQQTESTAEDWLEAETTPYGKYPKLVTYTLVQMKGANNSNLPEDATYEDNAYTRYLREMLNIQNENIYMESEDRYDEFVNVLVKDRTLPDVLVVSSRETLKELVENDLVEDLTEVFERSGRLYRYYVGRR